MRIRTFTCCFLTALACVFSVRAETAADSSTSIANASSVDRRIEVLIRSQFSVPPEYDLVLGVKTKSDVPGYDHLPVTIAHGGKQTVIDFLISKDCNTLARIEKFDISTDPARAINVENRPVRGNPSAKVQVINFDDLECPFCARLNKELSQQTLAHYNGLIKIVYKDYPLDGHPWALHAAVDANCLADLSTAAYWAYVDYVHDHRQDIDGAQLNPPDSFLALDRIAGSIGMQSKVDEARLSICLKRQDEPVINSSLKLGSSLGIDATPQIFVDGERLPAGARPIDELWPAIDRALKAQGIQPPPDIPQTTAPPADNTNQPSK